MHANMRMAYSTDAEGIVESNTSRDIRDIDQVMANKKWMC